MTRSRKPWLALAAVGAAALSGCGSSGSPTTTNAANSSVEAQTSSTAASSGLSDAQAALAQAYAGSDRALPSSSPKPPKGKTVWILSCSQAGPGCAVPAAAAVAAGDALGWHMKVLDGKFDPATWNTLIRSAAAAKPERVDPRRRGLRGDPGLARRGQAGRGQDLRVLLV
ncbi:MAG TPA: hypothetical protein VMU39_01900 [Solirubrobacteraceae bacterium]|nr:hypothetical protein [Solirubrobacteraceae bacterium]